MMVRTQILVLLAALAAGRGVASAAEPLLVSDAGDRVVLDLTIYAQDLALVRDVRNVDLPAGITRLEYRDVPARLDPVTVRVDAGPGFVLLEQDYEFDLISPERILERSVGRDVTWIQEDGTVVEGTILAIAGGPVYRVADRIVFEVPGRISLPELPADLRASPALVWTLQGDRAGPTEVTAGYLTGGLSWSADYTLELGADEGVAKLQAWVSLDNRSGTSYEAATLRLIAGDIRRVGHRPAPKVMMEMAARADAGFAEQESYDYHLYTLDRPVTLADRRLRQIALLARDGVPVTRRYRLRAGAQATRADGTLPVEVAYGFRNDGASGLDLPLPAGTVRVYAGSDGAVQLLGEDRIGHTPRGEAVEVVVGSAFDLVAERVLVESRRLGERSQRSVVQVTLRNRKRSDVSVEVLEAVAGEWRVTASTLPPRRVDARTLAFDAAVPAGGETVLEYTIEVDR